MEKKKKKLFDRIAPVYGMFFPLQKKSFTFAPKMLKEDGIFPPMQILDIGCGTGALLSVLESEGYQVTGIDPAKEMLRVAMWKTREQNIKYYHLKDQDTLPFKDNSFDAVISSHVLHGMPEKQRMQLYGEMKRISRRKVIIYDYNKNRSPHITFIEYLERGDYFKFIQVAEKEMNEVFGDVKITHIGKQTAWYVMDVDGPRIRAEKVE